MSQPLAAQPPLKPRRSARDRLARRGRIMERLREGRSYEEIAEAEGLSRERIRQIVVEALRRRQAARNFVNMAVRFNADNLSARRKARHQAGEISKIGAYIDAVTVLVKHLNEKIRQIGFVRA